MKERKKREKNILWSENFLMTQSLEAVIIEFKLRESSND